MAPIPSIGVVGANLLLFSVVFASRDENLRITRASLSEPEAEEKAADYSDENEPLIPGDESMVTSDHSDSDDDWEGVESTELDEIFSATAADRAAVNVSNEVQLQLYSLYKIAIEGPCSDPQPSALKMTARAKW